MDSVTRVWSAGAIAWVSVLGLMAAFQLWRGAWVDGTLFVLLVIVLIVDRVTHGRIRIFSIRPAMNRRWIVAGAILAAVILSFAPRHSELDLVVVSAVGVGVLVLAWTPAPATPEHPPRAYSRAAVWWSVLAVGLCVWEAIAFVLSQYVSEPDFPTVSVLLDPLLEWQIGRSAFALLWLAGGLWLLRVWRKR